MDEGAIFTHPCPSASLWVCICGWSCLKPGERCSFPLAERSRKGKWICAAFVLRGESFTRAVSAVSWGLARRLRGFASGSQALFSRGLMKLLALGADVGAEGLFPLRTDRQASARIKTIASSCQGQWWGEGDKGIQFHALFTLQAFIKAA